MKDLTTSTELLWNMASKRGMETAPPPVIRVMRRNSTQRLETITEESSAEQSKEIVTENGCENVEPDSPSQIQAAAFVFRR
ncbi:hypothetical protein SUGI_0126990 [Cryptomeria japonica]|nr:hypothetical protein SUGI_0126990 [Cryptomeria japonica]